MNIAADFRGFLQRPFNAQADVLGWTLFLGFALVVLLAWARVFATIKRHI